MKTIPCEQNSILESLAPYRIEEKDVVLTDKVLGRGGFGIVFLGTMDRSGKAETPKQLNSMQVAVKQLQATGTNDENKKLALVCSPLMGHQRICA